MASPPRFNLPGIPQHVVQRGTDRAAIFLTSADYQFFRDSLRLACVRYCCRLHAYVLMTNHFHLLLTPAEGTSIAKVMQSVGRRYVRYFNRTYGRVGALWAARYRANLVDTDRYLGCCYRYVEMNPVRAGLVTAPEDHPWSSHQANALGVADPLVTPHEWYLSLDSSDGGRMTAYRALFRDALDDPTLRAIREATNNEWALGSDEFHTEVATLVDRRLVARPRGGVRLQRERLLVPL